jgi:hypothetical protein
MKIRLRQRNHSRIQQNNAATTEYIIEAFAALGTMDSRRACAASCQLTAAPFGAFAVKL